MNEEKAEGAGKALYSEYAVWHWQQINGRRCHGRSRRFEANIHSLNIHLFRNPISLRGLQRSQRRRESAEVWPLRGTALARGNIKQRARQKCQLLRCRFQGKHIVANVRTCFPACVCFQQSQFSTFTSTTLHDWILNWILLHWHYWLLLIIISFARNFYRRYGGQKGMF